MPEVTQTMMLWHLQRLHACTQQLDACNPDEPAPPELVMSLREAVKTVEGSTLAGSGSALHQRRDDYLADARDALRANDAETPPDKGTGDSM